MNQTNSDLTLLVKEVYQETDLLMADLYPTQSKTSVGKGNWYNFAFKTSSWSKSRFLLCLILLLLLCLIYVITRFELAKSEIEHIKTSLELFLLVMSVISLIIVISLKTKIRRKLFN